MKKHVLAVSAALLLSVACLGAMHAVPAKATAQETTTITMAKQKQASLIQTTIDGVEVPL